MIWYDVYCKMDSSRKSRKLVIKNMLIDDKAVTYQIIEYQQISSETSSEGLEI